MTGADLGHYSLVAPLGAGGMGEVWRARDNRLGREVALKMLPEALADDPERMERFTREAKVLASLNHPNIAVLYGLEHLPLSVPSDPLFPTSSGPQGGSAGRTLHLLVMELIEGEDLAEIVARGPLPFDEAVSIALQIAEGLQAAHERGIVHRDLKPANIKVRPDGTVKVLDFGLATSRAEERAEESMSRYPTLARSPTAMGVILGTAGYMSPEQARGRPVDRRADIWAFGCLLFEMLAATRAFKGESLSDVMAAVLRDEPDWRALPADLNPVALHVLRRCLAKEPDRRFHHIADVRIELEEAAAAVSRPAATPRRSWRRTVPWTLALGAALVAAVAATLATKRGVSGQPLPTFRALTFHNGRVANARFAPDGKTVVYGASTRDRALVLMSTRTDSIESRPLDLPPADILGVSRDGRMAILLDRHCEGSWVSFGTLAAADLAGGGARPIVERVSDGDLSGDGSRLAIVREAAGLQHLEYPVGHELFKTHGWISHVRISPDADRVAFLHHPYYGDDRGFVAMATAGGTVSSLTDELSDSLQGLAWAPDGSSVWYSAFVFGRGGVVWSVTPGTRPVDRLHSPVSVRLQDIAPNGDILVVAGDTRAEIAGMLAGQGEERTYEGWNDDSIGGLAADGSMFAGNMQVATVDGEYAAYARRADGSPAVPVGYGDVFGMSPDGGLVFARRMTGDRRKIIVLPTGAGQPREIDLGSVRPDTSGSSLLTSTMDGRRVAFAGFAGTIGPRIYVMEIAGGVPRAVGPVGIQSPVISPDGARVACVASGGRITVYPVGAGDPLVVPRTEPGERPLQWSRDGRSLLLWNRSFPAEIQRVDLDSGQRERARVIMPRDPAGVLYGQILLSPGGDRYVYRYRRDVSTLFLVEGIR